MEKLPTDSILIKILIDVAVTIHSAFALFAVFGALIAIWWKRIIWFHIPAVLWAALIEFNDWICPITPLEDWLRDKTISGIGYIEPYIMPILYPENLTRPVQFVLGTGVLVINVVAYRMLVFRKERVKPGSH